MTDERYDAFGLRLDICKRCGCIVANAARHDVFCYGSVVSPE